MKTLSLLWGIAAFALFCLGLIPCFGWLNWLGIPFAVVGALVGIIAAARSKTGGGGAAIAGILLCVAAAVLGVIRLILGGGIV